ncbi:NAD(P)H-dependent oxidoreductase [Phenylobacterium immobile]|jgi:putative NADPH-quinone reductase|uniref:NAD(P)H-dependent oxidoreductase n=1 Tax=Phenylobacterium immobile TaxID=21 RepID=UPI000A9912D0|nr:NAD(P)H-dependent oxidoreductase [Phenylobacterium immobile]
MTRILILDGHPDPRPERLGRALVAAYAAGATKAGHDVRIIKVADLGLPVLRTAEAFASPHPPEEVRRAQDDIRWAQHLAIFHPLWLGAAPALLKGFFEQVFRYGFALSPDNPLARPLKGRTARTVVTMGMPAPLYGLAFGAFGVKALERSVLALAGFWPVRRTLLGGVGAISTATYGKWLARMRALGADAR